MQIIADFHIHSKYARACSPRLDIENIWKTSIIKGIDLVGTGDFTHPNWMQEITEFLTEDQTGFLIPKENYLQQWIQDIEMLLQDQLLIKIRNGEYPRFVLQTEINNLFTKGVKKYRIHNCFLINSLIHAQEINNYFSQNGKVESDGRLALRQEQSETLSWLKTNYPQIIYFPAHIWTPHFGVLGAGAKFKNLTDAYGEHYSLIDAIETGLSSDPIMNWIQPELDMFAILSNSDAHSPENLAREGNIFDIENFHFLNYSNIEKAIKINKYKYIHNIASIQEKNYLKELFSSEINCSLNSTIEFYPQEGKYYANGHSKCNYLSAPDDTIKRNGKCPICGGKITMGVFHRSYNFGEKSRIQEIKLSNQLNFAQDQINNLADKFHRPNYRYFVQLLEVIKEVWGANKGTKGSNKYYHDLIKKFGTEFDILLNLDLAQAQEYSEKFALALEKIRNGNININPGYDGNFGIVSIFGLEIPIDTNKHQYKQDVIFDEI